MKTQKLNVKKFNQFMLSGSNSDQLKDIVTHAVHVLANNDPALSNVQLLMLQDLGLLTEA